MFDHVDYENLYKTVFEEGTVAHAYYEGPEIRIVKANDTMLKYWGKDASVFGKTFKEALPELNYQVFPYLLEDVFLTGKTFTAREMMAELDHNGVLTPAYFNFSYKALYNDANEVIGIYHVAIDVTEQVIAKKNIEESAKRVRNIVENAPFPIGVYTGADLEIEMANPSIIDVWGKGPDVIGKKYTEILPELKRSPIFEQVRNVYLTGIPFRAKNQLVVLNVMGKTKSFYFDYQFTPLFDTNGIIYGVMNTAADVTDINLSKQKIEGIVQERTREINEKNAELEKMNINLQSFAFIASHDLQEPLRKVQTFASRIIADEDQKLSAESVHLFERMELSLARMRNLIKDLLEYSQLGSRQFVFEVVNLAELASEVKSNLRDEIEKIGAELTIGQMCSAPVIPFQIKQLLTNLINNSLKFYNKTIPLKIHVESFIQEHPKEGALTNDPSKKTCIIKVSDNGIGFEPVHATRIFEIFHRLYNQQEYQGTGIGLAIVKRIADNHNGLISATSKPGEGALFEFTFPILN